MAVSTTPLSTVLVCVFFVAACGGGGGGGGGSTSSPTYTVGGSVAGLLGAGLRLQLNAGSDLSVAANGNFVFSSNLPTGAAYTVTVAAQPADQTCIVSAGSGTVSGANVSGVTVSCVETPLPPLAVLNTSYQNFKEVGLVPQALPSSINEARAYADFLRRGRLDLFTTRLTYAPATTTASTATPAEFKMWRRQPGGTFQEEQIALSQTGCIHPRKAIVADFNGDSRPDVFVACHGYDAPPYPGERNKVVLSQADGGFVVQDASSDIGFFHAAAAADLSGDGAPDVVVTNNFDPASVLVLLNQGNGEFRREIQPRMPSSVSGAKTYFTVELTDINEDGKVDLLLGGHEWEGAQTVVFINPGANDFSNASPIVIPAVPNEGVVLDFAVTGSGSSRTLWLLRTSGGDGTFYQSRVIQNVHWPDLSSSIVLNNRPAQWVPWIIPATVNGQASIVSDNASSDLSVPQ